MTLQVLRSGIAIGEQPSPRIVSGHGVRFQLEDGRSVIDSSTTTCSLGHGHPDLVEAVRKAAAYPVVSDMWGWRERDEAAEELAEIAFAGESWVGGVRFLLSGGEANDQAISLAQILTERPGFAVREMAYHGGVGLAREATVEPQWHGGLAGLDGRWRPALRGFPVSCLRLPQCDSGSDSRCESCECFGDVQEALNGVACVLLDCTQGGVYPSATYQDRLAQAARRSGAIWIADEVVTGFGRWGQWFAFQRGTERPDMVTLGKGVTGGVVPGALLILSNDLSERMRDERWQSYGSLRGNTLAIAALRATLRVIHREGLVEKVASLGPIVRRHLAELASSHRSVRKFGGDGLYWTIQLRSDVDRRAWRNTGRETTVASQISRWALDKGALVGTNSTAETVYLSTPLTIEEEELMMVLDALDHALTRADLLAP